MARFFFFSLSLCLSLTRALAPLLAGGVMHVLLQAISLVASLLSPFVPTFSAELSRQLAHPLQRIPDAGFPFTVAAGHAVAHEIVAIVKQVPCK